MFKVKTTESKVTPAKKNITLDNIAVSALTFIDANTGENITEAVVNEFPDGVERIGFKISFELPDEEVDYIDDDVAVPVDTEDYN